MHCKSVSNVWDFQLTVPSHRARFESTVKVSVKVHYDWRELLNTVWCLILSLGNTAPFLTPFGVTIWVKASLRRHLVLQEAPLARLTIKVTPSGVFWCGNPSFSYVRQSVSWLLFFEDTRQAIKGMLIVMTRAIKEPHSAVSILIVLFNQTFE